MSDAGLSGMRLHHFGFVVGSIEGCVNGFLKTLDASWDSRIIHDPKQRVKVCFLRTHPNDALIELVEPFGAGSPVSAFLAKGGGMHHLCYQVDDIEERIAALRSRGAMIAKRPAPAVAFEGRPIAWMITREKLLIELLQR